MCEVVQRALRGPSVHLDDCGERGLGAGLGLRSGSLRQPDNSNI